MRKINILLLLSFFCVGNVLAEDRYFAVTEGLNTTTDVKTVTIIMTNDKKDCSPLLNGAIEGSKKFGGAMNVISSECLDKLPPDYLTAFNNKPIRGVMYVAYTNVVWPSRVLMYGIDESWLSDQGCSLLADNYNSFDKNARCVYGSK